MYFGRSIGGHHDSISKPWLRFVDQQYQQELHSCAFVVLATDDIWTVFGTF